MARSSRSCGGRTYRGRRVPRQASEGNFVIPHDERIQQWIEIPDGMEIPRRPRRPGGPGAASKSSGEDLDGMIVNVEMLEFPDEGEHAVGG